MCHGGQIHDLLHVALAQHGKAGLAAGHDVAVVAEDVQRLGGHGTGGHMEHGGQLLGGDLIHVGDHQQQTLRGGIGSGQSAGTQRAVYGTGCAGLGLHLHHLDLRAEDVFQTVSGPLVHKVGHGGRRGDGVDGRNFRERIGYMRGGVVAIHGLHFSYHVVCSFHFLDPISRLILRESFVLFIVAQILCVVNVIFVSFAFIIFFHCHAQKLSYRTATFFIILFHEADFCGKMRVIW